MNEKQNVFTLYEMHSAKRGEGSRAASQRCAPRFCTNRLQTLATGPTQGIRVDGIKGSNFIPSPFHGNIQSNFSEYITQILRES